MYRFDKFRIIFDVGEMYMESFKNVEHKISKYNEGNIVFVENEVCTSLILY